MGLVVPKTPHPEVSKIGALRELWAEAALQAVETSVFTVHRTYSGFDDYWETILGAPSAGKILGDLPPADSATLQRRSACPPAGRCRGPVHDRGPLPRRQRHPSGTRRLKSPIQRPLSSVAICAVP